MAETMVETSDQTRLQQALLRLQTAVGSVEGALVASRQSPSGTDDHATNPSQAIDERQGDLGFHANGSPSPNAMAGGSDGGSGGDSGSAGGVAGGEVRAELKAIEDLLNQAIALLGEADSDQKRDHPQLRGTGHG